MRAIGLSHVGGGPSPHARMEPRSATHQTHRSVTHPLALWDITLAPPHIGCCCCCCSGGVGRSIGRSEEAGSPPEEEVEVGVDITFVVFTLTAAAGRGGAVEASFVMEVPLATTSLPAVAAGAPAGCCLASAGAAGRAPKPKKLKRPPPAALPAPCHCAQ